MRPEELHSWWMRAMYASPASLGVTASPSAMAAWGLQWAPSQNPHMMIPST